MENYVQGFWVPRVLDSWGFGVDGFLNQQFMNKICWYEVVENTLINDATVEIVSGCFGFMMKRWILMLLWIPRHEG